MKRALIGEFANLTDLYLTHFHPYESRVFHPAVIRVNNWTNDFAPKIKRINPARAEKRIKTYLDIPHLEKLHDKIKASPNRDFSIRFGVGEEKTGGGNFSPNGGRGDFCLLSGSIIRRHLSLYYRSLEVNGGLGYDLVMIEKLCDIIGVEVKTVTFFAAKVQSFKVRGTSNEKLYPKLMKIFGIKP